MGNGCLPKTTILERRENNALRLLSSLSPALASDSYQSNSYTKKNVGPYPYKRYIQMQWVQAHMQGYAHACTYTNVVQFRNIPLNVFH